MRLACGSLTVARKTTGLITTTILVITGILMTTSWPQTPFTAHATTNTLFITELMPAPSSGSEWVELYNPSTQVLDLAGWILEDQITSPSIIFTFPPNSVLAPQEHLTIEVSNKLNNSGDGVTLKNAAGTVMDTTTYTSAPSDQAWARQLQSLMPISYQTSGNSFSWAPATKNTANTSTLSSPAPTITSSPGPSPVPTPNFSPSPSFSPTPTPSLSPQPSPSPNSSALPSPTPSPLPTWPSGLIPNEVVACAETGQVEWVEVYNPNPTTYQLTNWQVVDAQGNHRTVSPTVPATSYSVIEWSGSLLNNSGDTLSLLRPDGVTLFTVTTPACQVGESLSYSSAGWVASDTITKGQANTLITNNQISLPSPTPSLAPSPKPSTSPKPSSSLQANSGLQPTSSPNSTQKPRNSTSTSISKNQILGTTSTSSNLNPLPGFDWSSIASNLAAAPKNQNSGPISGNLDSTQLPHSTAPAPPRWLVFGGILNGVLCLIGAAALLFWQWRQELTLDTYESTWQKNLGF